MNNNEQKKSARAVYTAMIAVLMTVAVIVAIAGAVAKNSAEAKRKIANAPETTAIENKEKHPIDTEDAFVNKKDFTDGTEHEKEDETTAPAPETTAPDTNKTEDAAAEVKDALPVFVSPVNGEVLKECSLKVPVFSLTMEDYRTHSGIDVYAEVGTAVVAAADGTVEEIWKDPMMGTCLSIAHSGGAKTVYKNLAAELPENIAVGAAVKAGDTVASVGDTALAEIAEESHLHFEMSVENITVNPRDYLPMA